MEFKLTIIVIIVSLLSSNYLQVLLRRFKEKLFVYSYIIKIKPIMLR